MMMNLQKILTTSLLAVSLLVAISSTAMSEEKQSFTLDLKNKATNIQNWVQSRPDAFQGWVADTKEFQKAQWEEGKKQTSNNFAKLKFFFLGETN